MFLTTRGLILRSVDYKEADRILTVLTADEGKLTAKARAAARPRGRLSASTQLLSYSELTIFGNKGKWTVNEAVTIEQFLPLRQELSLMSLGSYFAELLEAVSDEDCPNAGILQLGLNGLYALSCGKFSPELVKSAFELRLMCLAGYEPELSVCAKCGKSLPESGAFVRERGELLCPDCRDHAGVPLGADALRAMRYIISAEPKRVFSFTLAKDAARELDSVCEGYARNQLDRGFRSLDYYKSIK